MSPGRFDLEIIRSHMMALDEALQNLRKHQGASVDELQRDLDRSWAVQRGLHLCAQ